MCTNEDTRNCNYNKCEYDVLRQSIQINLALLIHITFGFIRFPLGWNVKLENSDSDSCGVGIEKTQYFRDFE